MHTGKTGNDSIREQSSLHEAARTGAAGRTTKDSASPKPASLPADSFVRAEAVPDPYTDYTAAGRYADEGSPILPARYYENKISGNVYYKGDTISYLGLLEEAVQQGAVTLDETKSVWTNIEEAHRALIDAKAVQPYPDVSSMYSEDGQYRFRVENGQITGATRAFYIDGDGRKITAQYLAEQLASGTAPANLDGDWSFLAHLDNELYTKALEIGNAKRSFEQIDIRFENGVISEKEYLDELHPILLFFLGKDKGHTGARLLRELMLGGDFGKRVLNGTLAASLSD